MVAPLLSQIAATRYHLNDEFVRTVCDLNFPTNDGQNPCARVWHKRAWVASRIRKYACLL